VRSIPGQLTTVGADGRVLVAAAGRRVRINMERRARRRIGFERPQHNLTVRSLPRDPRNGRRVSLKMPVVRAVFMVCAVASSVSAQVPTGYYQGPSSPLPDSLREVRAGGRFTISIIRTAADAFERELLHHAEGLFPPRRLIEGAAAEQTELGHIQALTEAANVPGDRWWWRE
jgi:hypothetical protein